MTKKHFRKLLSYLSITSVMFAFQACYGTMDDEFEDILIEGSVVSSTTGNPIPGIQITSNNYSYEISDRNGRFSFYTGVLDSNQISLSFTDIDSSENGKFQPLDTLIMLDQDSIVVNVTLDPQ